MFELKFSIGRKKAEKPVEPAQDVKVISDVDDMMPLTDEQFEQKYGEVIRRVFTQENARYGEMETEVAKMNGERPVAAGGRVSIYEGARNFLPNLNAPVPTTFNFKALQFLQNLSIWNPHISMAVENIVALGNTDYKIDFGESVGEAQAAALRKIIWKDIPQWYEFADGEDSLDNDLLSQMAINGTISAEAVIRKDLRGIQNIVRVDPYYIRFAYDPDKAVHIPLQEIGGLIDGIKIGGENYPGYIALNPHTYFYLAMRRMGEMPYAIPPFLSAIESILIENDMIKNFQNMMRRLGMMGFLSVLVNAPQIKQGESQQSYDLRLSAYLEKIRPNVEQGFHRGVVIGFKDTHEFQVQSPMNPAAAETTMKMIKSLVYAGVKQDPNMHGENYSVTETFGRVILEKMTQQVSNYQRTLGTFKAKIIKLHLMLQGKFVDEVNCKYDRSSVYDEKREQEVMKMRIENAELLRQQGIIDQYQKAQMLGYDEPAEDEPLETDAMKIAKMKPPAGTEKKSNSKRIRELKKKFQIDLPVFDYFVPDECGSLNLDAGHFHDKQLDKFTAKYLKAVEKQYTFAIKEAKQSMTRELNKLSVDATLAQVEAALVYGLIEQWEFNFMAPVEAIVEDNIPDIYTFYRQDKSIFAEPDELSKQSFFVVPEAVFELLDYRAIEFLESLDKIYLGKFITDPDTEARIIRWIKEKFEAGNVPIGKNSALISEFIREFSDVVALESWKIRRIIDTTVNRSRNTGHVMYLDQALIVEYQVIEVMDDRTCGWCKHMNRKTFVVKETVEKFKNIMNGGMDRLPELSPFATTIKQDVFVKMSGKELKAKGIDIPAYHPHCRGRIIGHFKR